MPPRSSRGAGKGAQWSQPASLVWFFIEKLHAAFLAADENAAEDGGALELPLAVLDVEGRGGCALLCLVTACDPKLMPHAKPCMTAAPHVAFGSVEVGEVSLPERFIEMRMRQLVCVSAR